MLYREIGQTGCQVSQLGFGCMRLRTEDGTVEMMNPHKAIDQQLATRLIHHAMDCTRCPPCRRSINGGSVSIVR